METKNFLIKGGKVNTKSRCFRESLPSMTKKPTWFSKPKESLIGLNRKPDIQQTLVSETDNRAHNGIQRHLGGMQGVQTCEPKHPYADSECTQVFHLQHCLWDGIIINYAVFQLALK